MYKKILFVFLILLLMSSFGFLVRQELIGTTKFGFISKGALSISEIPAKIKHIIYKNYFKQQSSFLKTKKTRHSNKKVNLLLFIKEKINLKNKLMLLSKYDGNKMRTVVEIYDLENFEKIHTYIPNYSQINKLTNFNKTNRLKYDMEDFIVTSPKIDSEGNLYLTIGQF